MKKVIKIKESNVLDIINNIISEQETGATPVVVNVTNQIGTAPNFDGLKSLMQELKTKVEQTLRGNVPYSIKVDPKTGVANASNAGGSLKLSVTLTPTTEEDRDWYFDSSLAIYSAINTDSLDYLKSKVLNKAANKGQAFAGSEDKVNVLGKNTITLSNFQGLDPNDAAKIYKLYLVYIGAKRPEGFQDTSANSEPAAEQPKAVVEPQAPAAQQTVTEKKVTKTVSGSFTSNDGDSAHNFAELENKIGPVLKEVYDMGVNPKILSVTAKISKSGNGFSTSYNATIGNSDDGKAWMGFTSRGSFGPRYQERADGQIEGSTNLDGRSLEDKLKGNLGAGEVAVISVYEDKSVPVKQYFVQFTKPKEFPAHK
jgi:hypothetical protein